MTNAAAAPVILSTAPGEFLRPLKTLQIEKVRRRDVAEMKRPAQDGRAIRLYRWLSDGDKTMWSFQLRGPNTIGFAGATQGSDYVIATAKLSAPELRDLRDAIDAELASLRTASPVSAEGTDNG